MSIDTGYSNPIDLLKLILTYQNNGDNATGEASSTARIRSGIGVNGSFDSTTLDAVRSINIHCQVDDASKGSTDTLIDTICKMFNLVQYTDSEGYECVKYLFAEGSDVPIRLFTIDENVSIENFNAPDSTKICVNPVIKYAYNYGLGKYTAELKIDNVQTGVFNASHVSGFQGTDGETYWNKCLTMLWPLVRHIEDMDSDWSENEYITDYAGAKFRLENVIKLMRTCTMDFTVSFSEGCLTESGDIIQISFPHLSLTGDVVFDAVVTGITKSKASNSCTISVMFIGNSTPFELMDSADENAFPLIDSYDPQPLQINNSYFENGTQSPLTYIDPTARSCHITQINDSLTDLLANMDKCQIGIDTDHKQLLYTDDTNGFHYMLEGNGTQNRLLKYIDNYGHVGDSIIREVSGKIGIGLDAPRSDLHVHNPNAFARIVLSDINTGSDHGLELTVMSLTHSYGSFDFCDTPSVLSGAQPWLSKKNGRIDIGYELYPELSSIYLNGTVTLNKIASASSGRILVMDRNNSICETDLAGIGAEPAITTGTIAQYWRGDKTWQALNTTAVSEGTNLYFTNARVVSAIAINCPDLTAIEALTGTSGYLRKTAANTWVLDTAIVYNNNLTYTAGQHSFYVGTSKKLDITWEGTIHSGLFWSDSLGSNVLTANKLVFTNNNKYLTSTGIGTSAQFLKADGSIDSSTYMDVTLYPDLTAIEYLTGTSGLLKKTAANTWVLDTSVYITGNQTITLSGVITGSGATAITTSIADAALSIAKTSGLQDALDAKAPLTHGCTAGYIPWATSTTAWANSPIYTNGTFVGLRTTNPQATLHIYAGNAIIGDPGIAGPNYLQLVHAGSTGNTCYVSFANSLTAPEGEFTLKSFGGTKLSTVYNGSTIVNMFPSGNVSIGTDNSYSKLTVWKDDATTNSIINVLQLIRSTSGTAAEAGMGAGIQFALEDAGTNTINTNRITSVWVDATAANRFARMDFYSSKYNSSSIAMSIDYDGLIGIGKTSPTQKLDVVGSIKASVNLISDAWLSPTYGGGWYMSDATWIRSYGNKSIYQNSGVLRTDGTLQVGVSGATMNVVTGGDASFGCNVSITGNINCNNIKTYYGNYYSSTSASSYGIATPNYYSNMTADLTTGQMSGMSLSSGIITVVNAGKYLVQYSVSVGASAAGTVAARIALPSSVYNGYSFCTIASSSEAKVITGSTIADLAASGTITIQITSSVMSTVYASCLNVSIIRLSY